MSSIAGNDDHQIVTHYDRTSVEAAAASGGERVLKFV
jgi:hypothetical protein